MTQEEKQLLLKDLCARLPYGVKVENTSFSEPQIHTLFGRVSDDEFLMLETYKSVGGEDYRRVTNDVHYTGHLESIKPYLRPMSSMTIEEYAELKKMTITSPNLETAVTLFWEHHYNETPNWRKDWAYCSLPSVLDWLNKRGFDYRGLIPMGLALEAPANMYKTE